MKTAHFEPLKTFLSCLNSKQFLVTGMGEGGGGKAECTAGALFHF